MFFFAMELAEVTGEANVTFFAFEPAVAAAAAAYDAAFVELLLLLEEVDLSFKYLASMSSKKSSSLTIHPSSISMLEALLTLLMLAGSGEKEMALIKALT